MGFQGSGFTHEIKARMMRIHMYAHSR